MILFISSKIKSARPKFIYSLNKIHGCYYYLLSGCCEGAWRTLRRLGAIRRVEKEELLAYSNPYNHEMYSDKKWFVSLAEGDYEFVLYA